MTHGFRYSLYLHYVKYILFFLIFLISCADRHSERDSQKEYLTTQENNYEIHFINVGQGDAILVRTPSKTMLIDAGPPDGDAFNYLKSVGVTEIDIVVATHPHHDHIGGMVDILNFIDVGRIVDSGMPNTTLRYERYMKLIDSLEIPFTEGRKGMRLDLCIDAFAEIIHPSEIVEESLNDASIVIMLVFGNIRTLLTGDIERRSEQKLLEWHRDAEEGLRSHILKVPHHGSSTSTHTEFLAAVSPELSIIMCGLNNSQGHPHRQTLAALEAAGSKILRTDLNGHIVIRTNGEEYIVDVQQNVNMASSLININTASKEDLQYIVHIGPERADQIVKLRPFLSVDDLVRVNGIGHARLSDIKKQNFVIAE